MKNREQIYRGSDRDNSNIEAAVPEQGYQASEVASLLGCPASNVSGALQRQGAQNLSMNRTQTPVQTDPYIVGAMHVC